MKYALEILNNELLKLNKPLSDDEEDDLVGAILNKRQTVDIKLALKILNDAIENAKIINMY